MWYLVFILVSIFFTDAVKNPTCKFEYNGSSALYKPVRIASYSSLTSYAIPYLKAGHSKQTSFVNFDREKHRGCLCVTERVVGSSWDAVERSYKDTIRYTQHPSRKDSKFFKATCVGFRYIQTCNF